MPPDAAHPSLPTPGIHATLDQMSVGDNNSGPPTPRQQHSGHPLRGLPIPPPPPPPSHAAGGMAGPSAGSYPPSPSYPPGAAPHGRGGHRHHAELHSPLHPSQEYAEMMDRNHLGGHYGGPPPPSQQQHMDYPPPPALGYGSHQLVSLFRVSLPRPFCEGFSRANPPPMPFLRLEASSSTATTSPQLCSLARVVLDATDATAASAAISHARLSFFPSAIAPILAAAAATAAASVLSSLLVSSASLGLRLASPHEQQPVRSADWRISSSTAASEIGHERARSAAAAADDLRRSPADVGASSTESGAAFARIDR